MNEIPVLLLTGYLGSGKTTLLNRILNNKQGIRFAVIVNDIGEVNIDADLISSGGVVGQSDDSLVPLQNGCICCSLKMDLVDQLAELANSGKFDYIVIEASGVCEPEPIAQTINSMPFMGPEVNKTASVRLDAIVTVVDALRLRDEFTAGDALIKNDVAEDDIENLIIQQIEFCNIILLNKASEVTKKELEHVKSVIKALQPKAEIIECDYCDVNLSRLLNTHMFDFEQVATSAAWVEGIESPIEETHGCGEEKECNHHHHHHHHECDTEEGCKHQHHHHECETEEYGIGTFVYFARKPFSLNKFDYFCAKEWPKSVIRTKGVCYFKENPDMSYLFEQAGRQMTLKEAGRWYATAPEEDMKALLANDPNLKRDWDETYGDRMQKLVFIGREMDREEIIKKLDACLE